MNTLEIRGHWNEFKGKLTQKYAQITDDELTFVEGGEGGLVGRLQERLGKGKQELRREADQFCVAQIYHYARIPVNAGASF